MEFALESIPMKESEQRTRVALRHRAGSAEGLGSMQRTLEMRERLERLSWRTYIKSKFADDWSRGKNAESEAG
jgi:hypothetical protein